MPTILQLRRGTTAEHSSFTGAVGEITVDTTKDSVVVHDGATAGGIPLATEAYVTGQIQTKDNTDEITEGSTNLYYTDARADARADLKVTALIDSSPAALNTLNELAAALGDDANFSTTVTNSIATKLNSSAVSAFGLTLVDDADAATARTTLGLGTAATTASTAYATAAQGTTADNALAAASVSVFGLTLVDDADAATARTTLGLGTAATTAATAYATAAQGTTADSAVQNLADLSITATAAEINKLDGVTATTAELNFTDGVTSNIQTQLNGKQASGSYLTGNQSITLSGDVTGSGTTSIAVTIADDSHNHSSSTGAFTVGTDLTVSGGDIILSGTGRIQGVDTVTLATDAANKSYVDTAVSNLVDTAPGTLDTLNELAAALGDDPNFATTVSSSIGEKLAKASNLSDLADAATARSNLGLGTAATTAASAYATAAQGTKADNALPAASVSVFGGTLIDDADAATARTTLGLGTAATTASSAYATAAQGATADSAIQNLAGLGITSTAAEINTLDGYTGGVTELNYLDALHATGVTSTEFDYIDGVTSNIQTQLNAKLASSSYTAADVLTKIKTVDGAGSGLDADLLDGQSSAYYATAASVTANRINIYNAAGTLLN